MQKIVTYIANDGTEFDTKKECMEYEKKFNVLTDEDRVIFLNEDGTRNINFACESESNVYNSAYYIIIKDDTIIQAIKDAYDSTGVYSPFEYVAAKKGLFYYVSEEDEWRCYDDDYASLEKFRKKAKYEM